LRSLSQPFATAFIGQLATPGARPPLRSAETAIDPGQMTAVSGAGMLWEAAFRRHRADERPMMERAIIGLLARSSSLPFRSIADSGASAFK
jgi:hypothetical protein